ncbi:hypothetical protein K8T06_03310 [bacterium]|nr:hypothetical protein [bacterium]
MKKFNIVFCVMFFVFVSIVYAQTSKSSISYQGKLRDNSGNPLTGSYNMRFAITGSLEG